MNSMIRINLLPEKQGIKLPIDKIPIGTILGIALLVGFSYFLFTVQVEKLNDEKAVIRREISKLKKENQKKIANIERERDNTVSQINDYKRKINMVKSIVTGKDFVEWTKVLEALTTVTKFKKGSGGVWLTKFNTQADYRASISGVAEEDWAVVSNFIENLKRNDLFSEVNLSNAVKSFMDNGDENVPVYHFEITCRINKERM